jgi:hypothetical protein
MLDKIAQSLKINFDSILIDELLSAYKDAKRNFFLGGLRLSAVEGGRFCEAALRILEQATTKVFTPLNTQLDSEKIIAKLSNAPKAIYPDSIRIHIPRAIRVVYDIRNKRDAAHLADGIDPNLQDATLVTSNLDWILAEFVRLYHSVPANEAQRIIDGLVVRIVPAVQDFNGFLKLLNPKLKASDRLLVLLYEKESSGASFNELNSWVHPAMRPNLRRTLQRLVDDSAFIHEDGYRYLITKSGMSEVEKRNLHKIH